MENAGDKAQAKAEGRLSAAGPKGEPGNGSAAGAVSAASPQAGGVKEGSGELDAINELVSGAGEQVRGNLSAATIARLAGIPTIADLKLLNGKLDVILGKLNAVSVRLEKAVSVLNNAPTGSDLERIDVQIAALRTLIKDVLAKAADPALVKEAEDAEDAVKAPNPRKAKDEAAAS